MYLHGSHNKNYVYMWLGGAFDVARCWADILSLIFFRWRISLHNGNWVHRLMYLSLCCSEHISSQWSGKTWDEAKIASRMIFNFALSQTETVLKVSADPKRWLWLMLMMCDGDFSEGWKFLSLLFSSFEWMESEEVWGWKNYVFIFITQTRERNFFYIATYMICRLAVYCLSRSTRTSRREREENFVNEPSANGDGILLLFSLATHMMGGRLVCCVCLWIICWIMWCEVFRYRFMVIVRVANTSTNRD